MYNIPNIPDNIADEDIKASVELYDEYIRHNKHTVTYKKYHTYYNEHYQHIGNYHISAIYIPENTYMKIFLASDGIFKLIYLTHNMNNDIVKVIGSNKKLNAMHLNLYEENKEEILYTDKIYEKNNREEDIEKILKLSKLTDMNNINLNLYKFNKIMIDGIVYVRHEIMFPFFPAIYNSILQFYFNHEIFLYIEKLGRELYLSKLKVIWNNLSTFSYKRVCGPAILTDISVDNIDGFKLALVEEYVTRGNMYTDILNLQNRTCIYNLINPDKFNIK